MRLDTPSAPHLRTDGLLLVPGRGRPRRRLLGAGHRLRPAFQRGGRQLLCNAGAEVPRGPQTRPSPVIERVPPISADSRSGVALVAAGLSTVPESAQPQVRGSQGRHYRGRTKRGLLRSQLPRRPEVAEACLRGLASSRVSSRANSEVATGQGWCNSCGNGSRLQEATAGIVGRNEPVDGDRRAGSPSRTHKALPPFVNNGTARPPNHPIRAGWRSLSVTGRARQRRRACAFRGLGGVRERPRRVARRGG